MNDIKKYYKIPKENSDIRTKAVLKTLFRAVGYPAWVLVWCFGFQRFISQKPISPAEYLQDKLLMTVLLAVFVFVSGFFIFGFWKLFGKRTYAAEIVSMRVANDYGASTGDDGKVRMDMKTNLELKIRRLDGKRIKKIRVQMHDEGFSGYYREGNTVVVHREITYPEVIDGDGNILICMNCGHTLKNDADISVGCPICGRSIVKR